MDPDHKRRALVQAGIAVTSELSLDAVLQTLVRIAADLTAARYSALGVIDRTGTSLVRFVTHGLDDATRAAIGELPRGRGILGVLIEDARPLRLDDLTRDPRSVGFPPNHPPMHSFLGVPVMTRGVAFGNLYLAEKQSAGGFTEEDEENVRSSPPRRRSRSRMRAACSATRCGARCRRKRSSGAGSPASCMTRPGRRSRPSCSGAAVVERAETTDEAHAAAAELRSLVVETLQDVRRLAVELRPSALDDFGLEPALRRLGQSVREAGRLDVQVETTLGGERLPPDVETAVYRIVQEALTNVIKHADAARASIVVTRKSDGILVMIEDDGRGFDQTWSGDGRLGLLGMRERVELLDGSFQIDAEPGHRTTLIVALPMQ